VAGNAAKDTPPQAFERGGAGKRVGGPCFLGPIRPVTNSSQAPCSNPLLTLLTEHIRPYLPLKFSLYFLFIFNTLMCLLLLSLCFGSTCPPLTLLKLRYILCCFIVYFRILSPDLIVLSLLVFRTLWLFMHLLCTILGHDISNNHSPPFYSHPHYLGFTWLDFRVKHVGSYVSYIVFSIFLLRI